MYKAKTIQHLGSEFNARWIEGDLIHSNDKVYIHPISNKVTVLGEVGRLIAMHEVQPGTICRLTNYKDDDGNKIWENDLLDITEHHINWATTYGDGWMHRKTAEWDTHQVWKCTMTAGDLMNIGRFCNNKNISCKVIGNVFDNPDIDYTTTYMEDRK